MKKKYDTKKVEVPVSEEVARDTIPVPELEIPEEELYRMEMPGKHLDTDGTPKRKKKRKKKHYFLKFLFVVALGVCLFFFLKSDFFNIETIKVEDNEAFTDEQIIEKSGIKKGDNTFSVSIGKAEKAILKDPYFSDVVIRRVLPGAVTIYVTERTAAGAIQSGKEYIVIDLDGIVLEKTKKEPEVPMILGITPTNAKPGQAVSAKKEYLLTDTLNMLEATKETHLEFIKIDVSNTVIKAYTEEKLYCKGTPENILENIENGNLEKVLYDLKEKNKHKGVITIGNNGYISYNPKFQ